MINTEIFKEVSPLSDKDCFILIERHKSNFNFPIHIHPEFELNYIENAKGAQRIVGDSVEDIEDEELVLIANPQHFPTYVQSGVGYHPNTLLHLYY